MITGVNNDISQWMLQNFKHPVLVQETQNNIIKHSTRIKIGLHINIVSDLQDFQNNLNRDLLMICKNLILITWMRFDEQRQIEDVEEDLWKNKFINFLILF